jgi:hypothetical protein
MADTAEQTFSDIIRGMQYAVNTAQETLQNYQYSQMKRYFNDDGSPLMVWVTLSDGRRLEIPQITLVPQNLLGISKLEMSFKVRVAHTEVKSSETAGDAAAPGGTMPDPNRSSFRVQFARSVPGGEEDGDNAGPGYITVRIEFTAIPPPEGAARVLDALNMDIVEKAAEK